MGGSRGVTNVGLRRLLGDGVKRIGDLRAGWGRMVASSNSPNSDGAPTSSRSRHGGLGLYKGGNQYNIGAKKG